MSESERSDRKPRPRSALERWLEDYRHPQTGGRLTPQAIVYFARVLDELVTSMLRSLPPTLEDWAIELPRQDSGDQPALPKAWWEKDLSWIEKELQDAQWDDGGGPPRDRGAGEPPTPDSRDD